MYVDDADITMVDKNDNPLGLPTIGERIVLVRGDGPREGKLMAYATVTATDPIAFNVDETGSKLQA